VYGWSQYKEHIGGTEQIAFVCRPIRCEELNFIRARYTLSAKERINWGKIPIDIFFLERMTGSRDSTPFMLSEQTLAPLP
jgi:hypothetical protein